MAEPSALLHANKLKAQKLAAKGQQYSTRFLYKLAIFVIFMAILPLLPSEAPEFMNQSVLNRSWELLHLLLVSIAISYGLFSHRNTEFDEGKETTGWKDEDSSQAFVSHILHGSEGVFDSDDDEVDSFHEQGISDGSKIQTWSSQYRRNEPVVVVANGSNGSGHATSKPLFLPVRSLKSCAGDSASSDGAVEGPLYSMDEPKRTLVLPSPIPWGSRSGKMDSKDGSSADTGMFLKPPQPLFPPVSEASPSKTPYFRSSSLNSAAPMASSSPDRPSLSPEMRAKSSQDLLSKKSLYKSSPPPAPPPPPPPFVIHGHPYSSERKVVTRSFKDELKDLSRRTTRSGSEQQLFGYKFAHPEPLKGSQAAERINELMDDVANSSDDDSDRDDANDDVSSMGSPGEQIATNNIAPETGAEGNVDKKADEFIAKFREQIRLQRIECIKRSTAQRSVKRSNQ